MWIWRHNYEMAAMFRRGHLPLQAMVFWKNQTLSHCMATSGNKKPPDFKSLAAGRSRQFAIVRGGV
jgi:hypothetical protein